jgi:Cu+-exporting ATPase
LTDEADKAAAAGQTPMFAAVDAHAAGLIVVADPIKPDSAAAVSCPKKEVRRWGCACWSPTTAR